MRWHIAVRTALVAACTLAGCASPQRIPSPLEKTAMTTRRASGAFDVKLTPMAADPDAGDSAIARMSLDKQFHGELSATSKGQMLAVRTAVEGSAGYVALERVSGTLQGRRGTFALQHSGTMARGAPTLSVTVVPDSGTGELAGLGGRMEIVIEGGKHSYVFEYSLPETK
jgi:environmental stress-induced protein Ves